MEQTTFTFISWLRKHRALITFSLILHLVAAFFSIGFLHPDEHFQNFEFMMARWKGLGTDHLPWEFAAKMRPWLLPSLIGASTFIFPKNIFALETSWRIISGLFSFFSLFYFLYHASLRRQHERFAVTMACLFFWFLPFVHVRVSGEGFGSAIFILGLIPFFSRRSRPSLATFFLSGLALGAGIQFRYHLGFMLISLFFFERKKLKELSLCLLGIIFATLIGVALDSYAYQELTLAPWNYITENIFKDKASHFGTSPWYWYFTRIHTTLYPPVSIFVMASFLWQWITKTRSLISALTLPFFIVHSLVGHKEMRFLIPMIPFAVIIGAQFYGWLLRSFKLFAPKTWRTVALIILIGSSLAATYSSIKPASNDYAFLEKWSELENKPRELAYIGAESPFNMYQLEAKSLIKDKPDYKRLKDLGDFERFIKASPSGSTLSVIVTNPKDLQWIQQQRPHCHKMLIASRLGLLVREKRNPILLMCEVP